METISKKQNHNFSNLYLGISITWLGLHFYSACYVLFDHWHFTSSMTDKLLLHLLDTGLLNGITGRLIILLFMVLALAGRKGQKYHVISMLKWARWVGCGFVLFWGSPLIFLRYGYPLTTCCCYVVATVTSYCLLWKGGGPIAAFLRALWGVDDPFGRRFGGFPQEERKLEADLSLHLPAEYGYKGQITASWINLLNPRRGVLILGSPGSGKSRFVIEPLIRQWMQKGLPLFIYDFKYDALSRLVYQCYRLYEHHYLKSTAFCCINFGDLGRSHRCNVLEPAALNYVSDAVGASRTVLLSINKTWVQRQGEFFVESPINFLAALIWWLKKYEGGKYCTLPHAIELAQVPYSKLFMVLGTEPEVRPLINSFVEAYNNKTFEMLDSQISSAKVPLARLASPDLYYILTGNDLSLKINDPTAPTILCLGGDPTRQEALAPVLSLYIDRLNRLCNQPGRTPCALVCDEFATVRAYSMTTTMATARSNNIVPIIAVQDLSQLRMQYSKDESDLFLNATGNLLCGQVGGETAKWVSERFPKIQRERSSVLEGEKGESVSRALVWEPTVTAAAIAGLSSGEFVGMVADNPGKEIELKTFHARILREPVDDMMDGADLPIVREINGDEVISVFSQVKQDIANLLTEVLKKVQANPKSVDMIVK